MDTPAEKDTPKELLLHTCCGPCASGCFPMLEEAGRKFILFFSNSNLADEAEYEKRLDAAKTAAAHMGAELIADPYDHAAWLKAVSVLPGFADEPERGERCRLCFAYSLGRTAETAKKLGLHFATTLTVSPHKSSQTIFEVGSRWGILFEPWDFKKRDGFRKSTVNSKAWGLYRQQFCGCEFSRRDAEKFRKENNIKQDGSDGNAGRNETP